MKRTIALGAAWTASAAAAVGLGFLAVSLVDASASPGTSEVAATTSSPTGAPSPTAAPESPSATGEYATAGGTVVADCSSGSPVLAGVPAAGWVVDDSNDPGEMEFTAGDRDVEVHVTCVDGVPVFRLDDSSSAGSTATSGHDAGDDSSGRDGGGHGTDDGAGDDSGGSDDDPGDDGPGDDSSGRDGGGHGSDD